MRIWILLSQLILINAEYIFKERINVTDFVAGLAQNSDYQSYVGYIKVREKGSRIFYQTYSAKKTSISDSSKPLIIWLQGGPGCSSQAGNYQEIGPFLYINGYSNIFHENEYSWGKEAHLLFVDQPIGVGYSISINETIVQSTPEAANDFEEFLKRYYQIFPELASNDLYIFGESYAGHYIPSFASKILENKGTNKINLVGVGIGDGLTSVYSQFVTYDSYAYSIGVITNVNLKKYKQMQGDVAKMIFAGNYTAANDIVNAINGDGNDGIVTKTGNINIYNYRHYQGDPSPFPSINEFLNKKQTHDYYNIPDNVTWQMCDEYMFNNFSADISTSFLSNVSFLVKNIRVLIYNGQDDILINNAGIQRYINTLSWEALPEWQASKKVIWKLNEKVVGSVKSHSNFTYAQVYKAGHMAPQDSPRAGYDMIRKWIFGSWNGQKIKFIESK